MTGRIADVFGIRDRGVLAPGRAGDVVVFALDELDYRADRTVHDLPGGGAAPHPPAGRLPRHRGRGRGDPGRRRRHRRPPRRTAVLAEHLEVDRTDIRQLCDVGVSALRREREEAAGALDVLAVAGAAVGHALLEQRLAGLAGERPRHQQGREHGDRALPLLGGDIQIPHHIVASPK